MGMASKLLLLEVHPTPHTSHNRRKVKRRGRCQETHSRDNRIFSVLPTSDRTQILIVLTHMLWFKKDILHTCSNPSVILANRLQTLLTFNPDRVARQMSSSAARVPPMSSLAPALYLRVCTRPCASSSAPSGRKCHSIYGIRDGKSESLRYDK